jgi:hypothetical protein
MYMEVNTYKHIYHIYVYNDYTHIYGVTDDEIPKNHLHKNVSYTNP